MDNLSFKNGNPGAVQFGNFINYYQFHPPVSRINLLPEHLWQNEKHIYALDLGCNAGDLTVALYDFLNTPTIKTCHVVGVDIDPLLVERAAENNTNTNISFKCLDIMNAHLRKIFIRDYFDQYTIGGYTIVFCFSMTMWIHLNHGDEGLWTFLMEISKLGKYLVIEPQPWKCYLSAVKRMKGANAVFPLFKGLKVRQSVEDDMENFLVDQCNLRKVLETTRTEWGRKLLIFSRDI